MNPEAIPSRLAGKEVRVVLDIARILPPSRRVRCKDRKPTFTARPRGGGVPAPLFPATALPAPLTRVSAEARSRPSVSNQLIYPDPRPFPESCPGIEKAQLRPEVDVLIGQ